MDKLKDIKRLNNQSTLEYLSRIAKNQYSNSSNNDSEFELINQQNIIYSLQYPIKSYDNGSLEKYNNPLPQKKYSVRSIYGKNNGGYKSPMNNFFINNQNKIARSPDELERQKKNIYGKDIYNFYKNDSSTYNHTETNEIIRNINGNLLKNNYNNYKKNLVIQTTNNSLNNKNAVNQNSDNIDKNKINNLKYNILNASNKYSNSSIGNKLNKKTSMNDGNSNGAQKLITKPEIKNYLSKNEISENITNRDKFLLQKDCKSMIRKEKHSIDLIQKNYRNKEKFETSKTSIIQNKFYKKMIRTSENDLNYNSLVEKPYSNFNKFKEDNINNKIPNTSQNIIVKRNQSLKPKKAKKNN